MRKFIALLFTTAMVSSLAAQEAKTEPVPSKTATEAAPGTPFTEPISLIPDAAPQVKKPAGKPGPEPGEPPVTVDDAKEQLRKSKAAAAANELKERIRFREVKTLALKDASVREKWEEAQSSNRDSERRAALKQYYTLLAGRMLKIDSSLKNRIEKTKEVSLARIDEPSSADLNPSVVHGYW